jgi:hypothetical protein
MKENAPLQDKDSSPNYGRITFDIRIDIKPKRFALCSQAAPHSILLWDVIWEY